jgi:hypothetical protein
MDKKYKDMLRFLLPAGIKNQPNFFCHKENCHGSIHTSKELKKYL